MFRVKCSLLLATIFSTTALLSACQSVQDQSIPLSKEFTSKSSLIEFKRPTWQYKDAHFQQKLPGFDIKGLDISSAHVESSQLWFKTTGLRGSGIEISDKFLRFLFAELLDFREKTARQIAFKGERDFAFQTQASDSSLDSIYTRCRLLYLDDVLQIERPRESEKYPSVSIEKNTNRKYSFLRCELIQGNQTWHLSLNAVADQQPQIQLQNALDSQNQNNFQFEHVTDSQYLINGEWRELPLRTKTLSGLKVFGEKTQVAAMSFDGSSPKVWLNKSQKAEQSLLLLASSYALLMHDWLDQDWRSPFNQGSTHH